MACLWLSQGLGVRHDKRPKAGGILCDVQDEAMLTVGRWRKAIEARGAIRKFQHPCAGW